MPPKRAPAGGNRETSHDRLAGAAGGAPPHHYSPGHRLGGSGGHAGTPQDDLARRRAREHQHDLAVETGDHDAQKREDAARKAREKREARWAQFQPPGFHNAGAGQALAPGGDPGNNNNTNVVPTAAAAAAPARVDVVPTEAPVDAPAADVAELRVMSLTGQASTCRLLRREPCSALFAIVRTRGDCAKGDDVELFVPGVPPKTLADDATPIGAVPALLPRAVVHSRRR